MDDDIELECVDCGWIGHAGDENTDDTCPVCNAPVYDLE